jgi:Cdc6-like AAA superfamily ATPase
MDREPRLHLLTEEQKFAVDGILASSQKRENWLITGDAGRGKTFTVKEAMSALHVQNGCAPW